MTDFENFEDNDNFIGAKYTPDFLTQEQENAILGVIKSIDQNKWAASAKTKGNRKSLYFGAEYLYKKGGGLDENVIEQVKSIPELNDLKRVVQLKLMTSRKIGQINVHHYPPNAWIAPHIDNDAFGDTIVIVSLGAPRKMMFDSTMTYKGEFMHEEILLEPRSALVLQDEVRYHWKHSIQPLTNEEIQNRTESLDRYSVTFRSLKQEDPVNWHTMRLN